MMANALVNIATVTQIVATVIGSIIGLSMFVIFVMKKLDTRFDEVTKSIGELQDKIDLLRRADEERRQEASRRRKPFWHWWLGQ
jgi:uncharacterized protein YoxC